MEKPCIISKFVICSIHATKRNYSNHIAENLEWVESIRIVYKKILRQGKVRRAAGISCRIEMIILKWISRQGRYFVDQINPERSLGNGNKTYLK